MAGGSARHRGQLSTEPEQARAMPQASSCRPCCSPAGSRTSPSESSASTGSSAQAQGQRSGRTFEPNPSQLSLPLGATDARTSYWWVLGCQPARDRSDRATAAERRPADGRSATGLTILVHLIDGCERWQLLKHVRAVLGHFCDWVARQIKRVKRGQRLQGIQRLQRRYAVACGGVGVNGGSGKGAAQYGRQRYALPPQPQGPGAQTLCTGDRMLWRLLQQTQKNSHWRHRNSRAFKHCPAGFMAGNEQPPLHWRKQAPHFFDPAGARTSVQISWSGSAESQTSVSPAAAELATHGSPPLRCRHKKKHVTPQADSQRALQHARPPAKSSRRSSVRAVKAVSAPPARLLSLTCRHVSCWGRPASDLRPREARDSFCRLVYSSSPCGVPTVLLSAKRQRPNHARNCTEIPER